MHLRDWWSWWYLWSSLKTFAPITISLIALYIVLKDRKARLVLKERKGKWFTLKLANGGVIFQGIIEVYNVSNRANAIHNYEFWYKQQDGTWEKLDSEYFINREDAEQPVIFNMTPLALAPYSGAEVRVEALTKLSQRPVEMVIRIEAEDLFDKRYSIEVRAHA